MKERIEQLLGCLPSSIKRYIVEIGLIIVAGALAGSAIFVSASSSNTSPSDNILIKETPPSSSIIVVDIEGAVQKPGIYKLPEGARLHDLLSKANGFSEQADVVFFQKNFNRAQIINDQQKIYIPSIEEVSSGEFDLQAVVTGNDKKTTSATFTSSNNLISINSATESELDTLPGIGPVTAQKIIENRPYEGIEQLLEKKIVKSNVYEQIKDQLTLD